MTHLSVSVIIPAYRAARTIGRALDSVLGQTCPPDEILIVDDGSPDEDELLAALEPYRHQITLIRKANGGAASARNLGIDRSRGELIAFLDADDYWEPTKLGRQREIFRAHPEVGFVAGRFFRQERGPRADRPPRWRVEEWFAGFPEDCVLRGTGERILRIAMAVWTSAVILRRGILGDRRFETGLRTAEDRELWIRLIASNPVYMVSEPLATGVAEMGSLSESRIDDDYRNMLGVIRRHGDLLSRRELRDWEGLFFRLWASRQLGLGRPRSAVRPAWERLRRDPLSLEGWWVMMKAAALARPSSRDGDGYARQEPGQLATAPE